MIKLKSEDLQTKHWKELHIYYIFLSPKMKCVRDWDICYKVRYLIRRRRFVISNKMLSLLLCYILEDKKEKHMEKNNTSFETFV